MLNTIQPTALSYLERITNIGQANTIYSPKLKYWQTCDLSLSDEDLYDSSVLGHCSNVGPL